MKSGLIRPDVRPNGTRSALNGTGRHGKPGTTPKASGFAVLAVISPDRFRRRSAERARLAERGDPVRGNIEQIAQHGIGIGA